MYRTEKIRIYPNKVQEVKISEYLRGFRSVHNRILYEMNKILDLGQKLEFNKLREVLFDLPKKKHYEHLNFIDSSTKGCALQNLERIYRRYSYAITHKTPDEKDIELRAKILRFYSRFGFKQIFQISTFDIIEDKISIPGFGLIKAKFRRPLAVPGRTITITKERSRNSKIKNKYFASIPYSCTNKGTSNNIGSIGLDVGIYHFCTTSDGEHIDYYNEDRLLDRLEYIRKKMYSCKKNSNSMRKKKLQYDIILNKLSNRRSDFLHKVSKRFSNYKDVIVENFDIRNMDQLNIARLSKSWDKFYQLLTYKLESKYGKLHKISPYNTSRECSKCGFINTKNRKTFGNFVCLSCNHTINADHNAAINILNKFKKANKFSNSITSLKPSKMFMLIKALTMG